jgi:hypothetical protein
MQRQVAENLMAGPLADLTAKQFKPFCLLFLVPLPARQNVVLSLVFDRLQVVAFFSNVRCRVF